LIGKYEEVNVLIDAGEFHQHVRTRDAHVIQTQETVVSSVETDLRTDISYFNTAQGLVVYLKHY
jgi:hypothetical protein